MSREKPRKRWMWLAYLALLGIGVLAGDFLVRFWNDYWTIARPRNVTVRYDKEGRIVRVLGWNRANLEPLRHLTDLEYLDAGGMNVRDEQLKHISTLPKLQHLRLEYNLLSDRGLAHLTNLRTLVFLSVDANREITDAGLAELTKLTKLRQLHIRETQVTATGIQQLKRDRPALKIYFDVLDSNGLERLRELGARFELGDHYELTAIDLARMKAADEDVRLLENLSTLKMVHLGGTTITDAGLVHLKQMASLEELWLSDTQITDLGLEYLAGLSNLKALSLTRTKVTSRGLAHLQSLKQLESLHLGETQIDDRGVETLAAMNQVKKLWLNGAGLTSTGIAKLKAELPDAEISTSPPDPQRGQDAKLAEEIERHAVSG